MYYTNYRKKERKEVTKMIRYERDYNVRLDEMLDTVIRTFGHESKQAIRMATYVDKYYNNCN